MNGCWTLAHFTGDGETGGIRFVNTITPRFLGRFQHFEPIGDAALTWNVSIRIGRFL